MHAIATEHRKIPQSMLCLLLSILNRKIDIWKFQKLQNCGLRLCHNIFVLSNVEKGSGLDYLPSFILNDAFLSIPIQIASMLNHSLISEIFPLKWVIATVTPIPKCCGFQNSKNLFKKIQQLYFRNQTSRVWCTAGLGYRPNFVPLLHK